jgi:hypothetical protein
MALSSVRTLDRKAIERFRLLMNLEIHMPIELGRLVREEAVEPFKDGTITWLSLEDKMAEVYAELAAKLPESCRDRLKYRIQSIPLPDMRYASEHLFALFPYLTQSQLSDLLENISYFSDVQGAPAAWMAPSYRIMEALTPYIPQDLLSRCLTIIKSVKTENTQAELLRIISPHLSPDLVLEAVAIVDSFESLWLKGRTYSTLYPKVPASLNLGIEIVIETVSPARLRRLSEQLSPFERTALFEEIIDSIWAYYGGGAPSKEEAAHTTAEPPPELPTTTTEPPVAERSTYSPSDAPRRDDAAKLKKESSPDAQLRKRIRTGAVRRSAEGSEEAEDGVESGAEEAAEAKEVPEPEAETTFTPPPSPVAAPAPTKDLDKALPEDRIVNTGFTAPEDAEKPIDKTEPLICEQKYFFWLEVGRRIAQAIDVKPTSLPAEFLPEEAVLKVALFSFVGEILIEAGEDTGELKVNPDFSVRVHTSASTPEGIGESSDLMKKRLFFAVKMPKKSGIFRLRCNIYCKQVLVQSHIIFVEVVTPVSLKIRRIAGFFSARLLHRKPRSVLKAVVDYSLSRSLQPSVLDHLEDHRLSIMLNRNGDGTHGFRLFGDDGKEIFKQDASFTGQELQDLIEKSRSEMRKACWGDTVPWQNQPFRYDNTIDIERLRIDLVHFAKRGYRFYDEIINRLAGGPSRDPVQMHEAAKRLKQLMQKPSILQIALREADRHIIPVAMFYDYYIDTTARMDDYKLCPAFLEAMESPEPLYDSKCFRGECPCQEEQTTICPSGFWGYRHSIGIPTSVGEAVDAAFSIPSETAPQLTVAVSTDPNFELRANHEKTLEKLRDDLGWHYADTRDETFHLLKTAPSHLVYFYCHGGVHENDPYLQVGSPTERGITVDLLRTKEIFWYDPRPLIFINGCHTTALEPEIAFDFVTGFERSNAAGVIGTEITISESLACTFGEECLFHFLNGAMIGESIRRARLKLLKKGNPLGLVYIPFVVASLAIKET